MCTFYILPPRPQLGLCAAGFLQNWFPGLAWDNVDRADLAETLTALTQRLHGVYVVFREDLPEGLELQDALIDIFGAEKGDEIVEVTSGQLQKWRLSQDSHLTTPTGWQQELVA